jgi:hypothetical protein
MWRGFIQGAGYVNSVITRGARCITLVAMLLASVVTMLPIIMVNPDLSSLEVILFAFQIMATLDNLFFVLVDALAAYAFGGVDYSLDCGRQASHAYESSVG